MQIDLGKESVHSDGVNKVVGHPWSQPIVRQVKLDERFVEPKRVSQLLDLIELEEAELEVECGETEVSILHAPSHVVEAVLTQSTVSHVEGDRSGRLLWLHNSHQLVTLITLNGQTHVDDPRLLLDSLDESVHCLSIVIEIVHCHIEPVYMKDLIS